MADDITTSYYLYDTASGIISADTADIMFTIQSEWQNALGGDISLDASTPQGRIIEVQTSERALSLSIACLVANQINPNYSTGQYLDALASLFGVQRRGATNTLVYATVTGRAGTVIEPGFRVATALGNEFQTEAAVTIGTNGTVDNVLFYAVEPGAIPAAANTLNSIVTAVDGVETVNNSAAPVKVGTEVESDLELRRRATASRYSCEALPGAVVAAINTIPEVVSYWFYNNGEGFSVWVKPDGTVVNSNPSDNVSVEVAPHSVILMAKGGSDADLANALFVTRSAGCGFTAAVYPVDHTTNLATSVTVTSDAGAFRVAYKVNINRPVDVPLYIAATVRKNTYTGTDAELIAAVQAAVTAWTQGKIPSVDKPEIGSTIYPYEIGAAISDQLPEIVVQNVQIGTASNSLSNSAVVTNKAQIVVVQSVSVTVNA